MRLYHWVVSVAIALAGVPGIGARTVPRGWSVRRRADPEAFVPLKFSLAQSNVHNLDAYLLDVADPRSPNYGKYWSPNEVTKAFRPSQDTIDAVRTWLVGDHGVAPDRVELARKGDAIRLNATIAEAERMLGAEYFVYSHDASGAERVGCHGGYSLPAHVAKHVDLVWPTVHISESNLMRRAESPFGRRVGKASTVGRESGVAKTPISVSRLLVHAAVCIALIMWTGRGPRGHRMRPVRHSRLLARSVQLQSHHRGRRQKYSVRV